MLRRHTFSPLCALLFFGMSLAIPAHAEDAERMQESGVLRLNIGPNGYPPYMIVDEDGTHSGIVWDVVTRIAVRLNYKVEPHRIPRKRVDQMILEGYIDATPRAREWTQKPERFVFTQPITEIREVFFTTRDTAIEYDEPADIEGETVVTHLGYRYP